MSVVSIPTGLMAHTSNWGVQNFDLAYAAGDVGALQARRLAPPRWTLSLAANLSLGRAAAAAWRAMILELDGQVNQLAGYDLKNPTPAGTLAGSPVLAANVAVGDTSLQITTTAGATLLRGDKIQLGAGATRQLFENLADATANGAGLLVLAKVRNASRYAVASGGAVVWSQPICLMRRVDRATSWSASADAEGGFSLSLIESWEQ